MAKSYPVNAAIFAIAAEHDLSYLDLADLLYSSWARVASWGREKPNTAPLSALALLCYQLGLREHALLRAAKRHQRDA